MIATLLLSTFFIWHCPERAFVACSVVQANVAAASDDQQIILIYTPRGRKVIPKRRKTDWSRNIQIDINASDVLIVNGELVK